MPYKNPDLLKLLDTNDATVFINTFEEIEQFETFRNQTQVSSQTQITEMVQKLAIWSQNFTTCKRHIEGYLEKTTDLRHQANLVWFWGWMSGCERSSLWAIEKVKQHRNQLFPIEIYPPYRLFNYSYNQINQEMEQMAIDLMSHGHRSSIDSRLRELAQQNHALVEMVQNELNCVQNVTTVENKRLDLNFYFDAMFTINTGRRQAKLVNQWLVSRGTLLVPYIWFKLIFILFLLFSTV